MRKRRRRRRVRSRQNVRRRDGRGYSRLERSEKRKNGWMLIVKAARKSVTLFKPLETRTSADRDESYPRIRRRVSYRDEGICALARARAVQVFMRAGAGARFLPSDGSLFRALHARMCTRTRARPHPRARTKKMFTRLRTRGCAFMLRR